MRALLPADIRAPFGNCAHGIEVAAQCRLVQTGQLGVRADDTVPQDALSQARICFENIRAILAAADMGPGHVIHLRAYVTDRAHMAAYMQARDAFLGERAVLPTSTLLIVSGFTRPEFKVEVEALAAAPDV